MFPLFIDIPFLKPPSISKCVLDLYKTFTAVQRLGGFTHVSREKERERGREREREGGRGSKRGSEREERV